jgi:hypothetical protein
MGTKKKNSEILIGALMVLPLYIFVWIPAVIIDPDNSILVGFVSLLLAVVALGSPVLGILLIRRLYPSLFKKGWLIAIGVPFVLAVYFYFQTYFVEHQGWEGLGYFFYMLFALGLVRIILLLYYGKCFGVKRAFSQLPVYAVLMGLFLLLGNKF